MCYQSAIAYRACGIFEEGDMVMVREASTNGKTAMIGPLEKGRVYGTRKGDVKHDHIIGKTSRDRIRAHSSKKVFGGLFILHHPTMEEYILNSRRTCTPIYPKDASTICALLDILPGDTILEAGTGNAGLTLFLAKSVGEKGKVFTVERNEHAHKHAQHLVNGFSKGTLAAQVEFHHGSVVDVVSNVEKSLLLSTTNNKIDNVTNGVESAENESEAEKKPLLMFDGIALDMPTPWVELEMLHQHLKTDRYCVCYLPNMSQVMDLIGAVRSLPLLVENIIEVDWKEWDVRSTVVRNGNAMLPKSSFTNTAQGLSEVGADDGVEKPQDVVWVCHPVHRPIGHTAFLVCLRKCVDSK
ncbi:hypothetical protein H4219_005668 [Mycoemilia scoparia]|uniref:tRNA (adenine(58)-N(1))-methyltransferase catalytic subunit TRM61 n=1 Tax=Mycoemilia scoparia TaxID=417184 RepID=A0A9W7ZTN3_9FUNG|nr:hypothetical protein H4219_005668 [Mycoemilia scoparia]